MRERDRVFRGPRARAAGAMFSLFMIAGCSTTPEAQPNATPQSQKPEPTPTGIVVANVGTPEPSPSPIIVAASPSELPKPTPVVTSKPSVFPSLIPSETATPEPTAETSPSATPEPTQEIKKITAITESKEPKDPVTAKVMEKSIKIALDANPDIKEIWTNVSTLIQDCEVAAPGSGDPFISRLQICQTLVLNLFTFYTETGDEKFLNSAKRAYFYTLGPDGIGSKYKDQLDKYLKNFA